MIKYPIGVQYFEGLIKNGYSYVDKTSYIRELIEDNKIYFLGRPRRFGKSLFLSTLEAFFSGKRELFKGLDIDSWEEWDWSAYPIIHIDLNAKNYQNRESLEEKLNAQLLDYEILYNSHSEDKSIEGRFQNLIRKAFESTGREVVVLIDEYDKPILDTMHDDAIKELHRDSLRAFYSVLKSSDRYLKFCFLTGVTKFGQLNIFSGLNNLRDISLANKYAGICGITENELHEYFHSGVEACSKEWECSVDEAYDLFKKNYDGYHFSPSLLDVYNPWSVLNSLANQELGVYWNASGGSLAMLYKLIKADKIQLSSFSNIKCTMSEMQGVSTDTNDSITILYQTGYLTIERYDADVNIFTLNFPNTEVERGFIEGLLPAYSGLGSRESAYAINYFVSDIKNGEINGFLNRMQDFFAEFPYENALKTERDFQNVMYCIMSFMGLYVKLEQHSSRGSADMVVFTTDNIFIFEFKLDKSPQDAISQIKAKGYAEPFRRDGRKKILVGVEFSSSARNIRSWEIEKID